MTKSAASFEFIFPKEQLFLLEEQSGAAMPWKLTGPNYCCLTRTLSEGLYLLGVTAPRRFALKDAVYISTMVSGQRKEYSLLPIRPAYTVQICSWKLHTGTGLLCGEFASLPEALDNFSDFSRSTSVRQRPSRPALTVV